jgi:hypothetical protein
LRLLCLGLLGFAEPLVLRELALAASAGKKQSPPGQADDGALLSYV